MNSPRILVVKLSSLGDLFHALPLVHRLRTGWGATIDWVTQPEYAGLVSRFRGVERVIPFPRHQFWRGMLGYRSAVRSTPYDLGIDLQGLMKSTIALRMARPARSVGLASAREVPRHVYDEVAPVRPGSVHAVDRLLDVGAHLGIDAGDVVFDIETRPVPAAGGLPRIGVVPRSRWEAKNWPASRFAEVIRRVHGSVPASWFLVGGPDDAAACRAIAAACPHVQNTCGTLKLPGLCDLLASMDVVISVDSGPMHAAAALGVPVVAVFGPTDPSLVGPYGPGHCVIQSAASRDAAAASGRWKDVPSSEMMDIDIDEVCAAVTAALSEGARDPSTPTGGRTDA